MTTSTDFKAYTKAEPAPNALGRITQADVDAAIVDEEAMYSREHRQSVVTLTLDNGFTVIGTSACVLEENFDPDKGREAARKKAVEQVWMLLGFRLRERLFGTKVPTRELVDHYYAGYRAGRREVNKEAGDKAFQSGLKQGKRQQQAVDRDHKRRIVNGDIVAYTVAVDDGGVLSIRPVTHAEMYEG